MIVCLLLRTWGVWFLAVQPLVKAEVTLENGAYRDLVVSFSSNLPADDGRSVVNSMEELLKKTSTVLHNAIGIPIGHVTFVLPDAWDVADWAPAPGTAPPSQPDILVEHGEGSPFGKGPFAQQFGGCGVRGAHIDVPYNFLSANQDEYPKEKLLAREWLKFRYGVFDENGFPGDPMYPDHFTVHGDEENVHITECTDPSVEYEFRDSSNETCSLGQDTCKIRIGSGGDEVKSSLMYFHEDLKNVEHVCGKDYEHNFLSPSKQNLLCSEKDIWKVLKESPDFKDLIPAQSAIPEFHYVKISKPKVYIVLENTDLLQEKKDEVIFALRRVAFDLPQGSYFGLRSFSLDRSTAEIRSFSALVEDRNIINPPNFEAPPQNLCPLCALEKAIEAFPPEEPGLVILITASNLTDDVTAVIEKLKKSQLLLLLMTIRDPDTSLDSYNNLLEQLEDNAHLEDLTSSKIDLFKDLYTKITSFIPYNDSPKEVAVAYKIMSPDDSIEITQNDFAEKFTIWTGNSIDDKKLSCTSESGSLSKDRKVTSIGKFTFNSTEHVTCRLNFGSPVMTQVTITSTPGKYLSAKAWVHDTTPKDQPTDLKEQMPVIIYAKIDYWGYPVIDAEVTAVVTVVTDDGGNQKNVELKDNGKGDPDITLRDGIYSGYFYEFTKEGFYDVEVQMKSKENSATALKNGNDRCCGSQVNPTEPLEESTMDVPSFKINALTKFQAISGKPEKGYPPSRILDLRVTKFEPPSLLELSWTAPEGVDQTNALPYILKSFTNRQEALGSFDSTGQELAIGTKTPWSPGEKASVTLQLDGLLSDNTTHYLTLLAVGKAAPGQPSNVVTVAVPEAATPTEPPPPTDDPIPKVSGHDKTTIAIVIGVLVGVVVVSVCLYLVVYCLAKRKRKAKEEAASRPAGVMLNGTGLAKRERKTDEEAAREPAEEMRTGGGLRINSIPADVILKHHSEVVQAKKDHKDPPIFTEEAAEAPPQTEQEGPPEVPATLPLKSPKRMTVV